MYIYCYICENHSELWSCFLNKFMSCLKFPDTPELQAVSPVEMLETKPSMPSPKLPPKKKNGCKNLQALSTNEFLLFLTRISLIINSVAFRWDAYCHPPGWHDIFRWDHNLNLSLFTGILRGASQGVSLRDVFVCKDVITWISPGIYHMVHITGGFSSCSAHTYAWEVLIWAVNKNWLGELYWGLYYPACLGW